MASPSSVRRDVYGWPGRSIVLSDSVYVYDNYNTQYLLELQRRNTITNNNNNTNNNE